ncbi:MAG: glycosyltransferase family 4 protein [Pseudomonadota bacterium]
MISVLCVHQGVEKYGSDRSFVDAVRALEGSPELRPSVLLPGNGPILSLLKDAGQAQPTMRHLWVLRRAGILRAITIGLPGNLLALIRAGADLFRYQTVYVNTVVLLDFLLASIITRKRMIVHVREIPIGISRVWLRRLLILSDARVLFNSKATAAAFDLPARQPQAVVYNGFAPPPGNGKRRYSGHRPLRVLCIGRLNAWKGQDVLIDACARIPQSLRSRLKVRIVGGVYRRQTHFRTRLETAVVAAGLEQTVALVDFADDPGKEYTNADVVVVPSIRPEPFGRVAVEAMAYGCAVLAADHGGLSEIVIDGKTGCLLPPGSPDAIAEALLRYCDQPYSVMQQGSAGRRRFQEHFTQAACDAALLAAFEQLVNS